MKNSEHIISIISFSLFILLLFIFFISIGLRYRKRKKENEILKANYLIDIQNIRLEIHEETLQYVSRELHDNLGQIASLIKINLNTIDTAVLPTATGIKIEDTRKLMRRLGQDIKILSVGIRKMSTDQPFLETVDQELMELKKSGIFNIQVNLSEKFIEPQQEKGLMIFRMLQEIINNAIKHSQATELNISFLYKNGASVIELQDNGIGFNVNNSYSKTGSGIDNLHNRARLINANLKISSIASVGTTVTISFN